MYCLIIAFFLILQPMTYIFPAAAKDKAAETGEAFFFGDLEDALDAIADETDEIDGDLDVAPTEAALAILMRMADASPARTLPRLVITAPLVFVSGVTEVETPSPAADSPRAPRGKKKKGRILVRLDVKTLSKIKAAEERKEKLLAASAAERLERLAASRARRMGYSAAQSAAAESTEDA